MRKVFIGAFQDGGYRVTVTMDGQSKPLEITHRHCGDLDWDEDAARAKDLASAILEEAIPSIGNRLADENYERVASEVISELPESWRLSDLEIKEWFLKSMCGSYTWDGEFQPPDDAEYREYLIEAAVLLTRVEDRLMRLMDETGLKEVEEAYHIALGLA